MPRVAPVAEASLHAAAETVGIEHAARDDPKKGCCSLKQGGIVNIDNEPLPLHRFVMAGLIFIVWVLMGLGCGDEPGSSLDVGVGAQTPSGTSGSAGPAMEVVDSSEGEVIRVREGAFSEGAPPLTSPTISAATPPAILSLTGPQAVTNGGTAVLLVQLAEPMDAPTFVVQLMGEKGYHTVLGVDSDLDGVYEISVQVRGEAEQTSLILSVASIDSSGNVGPYQQIEIELVHSGTGDVKVTLSFDRLHDLDLHVIEPGGDEIFYQRPASATSGQLDLDAGANCQPSSANTENVFWPRGGAPLGEYRVSVHNYQQCSPGEIPFSVRIAHDDQVITYEGKFADGTAAEVLTASSVQQFPPFRRDP
jgi:hypothetical protein